MSHTYESVAMGSTGHTKRYVEYGGSDVAEVITTIPLPTAPENMYFKFFASSSGGISMNTTGGSTGAPENYNITASTSQTTLIRRINIVVTDSPITATRFGGLSTLTNGLKIQVLNSTGKIEKDYLDGQTIQKNSDWGYLAGVDVKIEKTSSSTDDSLSVRWTLGKSGGGLLLTAGEQIRIVKQDSFGGIVDMKAMAQGVTFDPIVTGRSTGGV